MLCNFTPNVLLDLSQAKMASLGLSDLVEFDLRMQILFLCVQFKNGNKFLLKYVF